jgi:hypothetical protein
MFSILAITLRTTKFNIQKILSGSHNTFMCFVWISEQTATFALHNISKLVLYNQWRTEGLGGSTPPPPRNSEILTKLSRIPSSVENTSVTV